jgi:hypothetical protein
MKDMVMAMAIAVDEAVDVLICPDEPLPTNMMSVREFKVRRPTPRCLELNTQLQQKVWSLARGATRSNCPRLVFCDVP